jgi:hypothetical protein
MSDTHGLRAADEQHQRVDARKAKHAEDQRRSAQKLKAEAAAKAPPELTVYLQPGLYKTTRTLIDAMDKAYADHVVRHIRMLNTAGDDSDIRAQKLILQSLLKGREHVDQFGQDAHSLETHLAQTRVPRTPTLANLMAHSDRVSAQDTDSSMAELEGG